MTTQEVANRLVEMCRSGNWKEAQNELYADHAISIEPAGAVMQRVEGIEAIREKGKKWESMIREVHGAEVSDPLVAGNTFAVKMTNDATMEGMGRVQMAEICLYHVEDGKIISEQFFYPVQEG